MNGNQKSRRWLQFSLRALLILILLAGVAAFWLRSKMIYEQVYDCADLGVANNFNPLTDLITTMVEPESWDDVGGPATILVLKTDPLQLKIRQTLHGHELIRAFLDALEKLPLLDPQATPKETRILVGTQRDYENKELEIVIYPVGDILGKQKNGNPRGLNFTPLMCELYELDEETWDNAGGRGSMMEFRQRGALVVSNTKAVQDKVLKALLAKRKDKSAE